MIKIKRAIDLFRLDKFQLIKKINTLELENSVLEQTIKDELYKIFMDKLREPQELDRVKKENRNLRSKVKTLKALLKVILMESEILSIETVQKLARLEKVEIENKQYEKIICDFDREVNRLFNIIKDAYEYLDKKTLCFKDDKDILKRILSKGLNNEVDNVESISR